VRPSILAVLSVLLLLTGCGDDESSTDDESTAAATSIDGVAVGGEFGTPPEVEIDAPVSVEQTTVDTLAEGDGEKIVAGDTVVVDYVGLVGRTGDQFDSSFDRGQPATFSTDGVIPGFAKAVEGQTVGSRVAVAVSPEDGYGAQGNPEIGVEPGDTLVFVIDIVASPLAEATGQKRPLPASLPQLQLNEQGHPTEFVATKQTADPPEELASHVIIQGTGPTVQPMQTMLAHYHAQIYPDGTVFDSSWVSGAPQPFQIGASAVIPCWDKALAGKDVGSRVVLVCPPSEAYGKQGNPQAGIKPNDTLIFVVDILAAY